ncbi:hypothetical protein VK90_01940 [Bacillus sp. LK2]|nr:hypothetical protein VK90_01940 [Bacillus sp. LK2]
MKMDLALYIRIFLTVPHAHQLKKTSYPIAIKLRKANTPKRKNKPFSVKNTRNFHPGGVIKFLS